MDTSARRRTDTVALPAPLARPESALPVVVWSSPTPGPCAVVTANVHGDEVTGVAAVHALDDRLQEVLLRGSVVLYPTLNPRGLVTQTRTQPDDGVDLNRVFPGEAKGGAASKLAHAFWADLSARRPAVVLDLHSDSAASIPYALVDRAPSFQAARRAELERRMATLARASGLFVLLEYPTDEYIRFRLDRSLAGAVVNHLGVPALTLEVGARRSVDPATVDLAVDAVLRVLAEVGVCTPPASERPAQPRGAWRRAAAPRVQTTGLFEPRVRPGAAFVSGDVLGSVRALDGTVREVVRADGVGRVVSWTEQPWMEARAIPGTLAVPEGE